MSNRSAELAQNLQVLRHRIELAALSANRNLDEIQLIAVSKTWPASDVRLLHELGLSDFAENRAQEAVTKSAELESLDLRWHHVGQIQTNKAKAIVSYADVVHSIDRLAAAQAINSAAVSAQKTVEVFLQVSLDTIDSPHRAGIDPTELMDLAAETKSLSNLKIIGLMAVAPLGDAPGEAFSRLNQVVSRFREIYPTAASLSIGMSGDFEAAIAAGATHLRIGSILFGNRA